MLYRGGILLALLLASCQFRPEGGAVGDDDGTGDSDALTGEDAPAPDAPTIAVDAPGVKLAK